ncbi:MAG: hypothetical protein GX442_24890 [Candidatus Riflebacteria bacterium]|nr:hypothetical protein [Candidatus Riflebacteria bacterium]
MEDRHPSVRRAPGVALVLVLVWSFVGVGMLQGATLRPGPSRLREKGRLLAERFARESRAEVARRERGGVQEADRKPPQVGDEESFFLDKDDTGTKTPIPAVLRLIGRRCYVYVEKGQEVDRAKVTAVAKAFDESVYPLCTVWFGSEWTPGIDGDPRITLLLVDGLASCDGYFDPEDEYTREKCPTSNEREMVVLAISRLEDMADFTADLLAHEFQHMIHWSHDPREATWVDEACSMYAGSLYRHFPFTVEFFLKNPQRCLIDWDDTVEWSHYGNVYLFMNHLVRAAATDEAGRRRLVRAVVASRRTSIGGITEALQQGGVPLTFNEVFRTFAAALHLGASLEGPAGTLGFDPHVAKGLAASKNSPLKPMRSFPSPLGKVKGRTKMWSAGAVRFRLPATPRPVCVSFAGRSFEGKRGRNFFDVGLLFVDRQGKLAPQVSWMTLRDNAGETEAEVPAGGYDDLLVVIAHRGPLSMPANEKKWPTVPFQLDVRPAGASPDADAVRRFEELHQEP